MPRATGACPADNSLRQNKKRHPKSNKRRTMSAEVVIVGSVNQDYIIELDALPEPGQTVLAHRLHTQSGGKGANQAVAAARLGSPVTLIAAVGDDAEGASMLSSLR